MNAEKEALQYVVGLAAPIVREIGGEMYSDKPLHRVKHNPKAEPIILSTLTSLVEYIRAGVDRVAGQTLFVHVESPTRVSVFSKLDEDRERETLAVVTAQVPSFEFNQFMDHERFCIALQSKFVDVYDRPLLLKFAGTVESGSVAEYGDDGITQKATVKTGIASKDACIVPNPVNLVPFRTFIEVEQPLSRFIFRMKQDRSGEISCALFEADGGAWKTGPLSDIKAFLEEALEGVEDLIVIS
ncbi:MAG: hypothetical protein IKC26_02125 [Clostridia bacterium]|nr:hypothetical protein [Clostridia bacterium]